jgi:hypothetical protein
LRILAGARAPMHAPSPSIDLHILVSYFLLFQLQIHMRPSRFYY